ncbi:hypothetical protein HY642_06180 [Candidatus Woesearchaeota archaeon]|nr:hypothetical protein [Candidatus Woesearchaeota archaeon]
MMSTPGPTRRTIVIALCIVAAAALGVIAARITTDTQIVEDTITTETINTTSLSVSEISGHRISGQLDMAGNRITDVQNPVNCQDVATKDYTDKVLGGQIPPGC